MTSKNSSTSPRVSIIIPTHGRPQKLKRAIESALDQTYKNIEILVANDNPVGGQHKDETHQVLSEYIGLDNFKHINTGGIGGGLARNAASEIATGEYFVFLDDDDIYKPNKVETQISFMRKNDLDFSFQDVEWRRENGKLAETRTFNHVEEFTTTGLIRAHLVKPISPSSIYMTKSNLYRKVGGFANVKTGQDWHFALRCFESNAKVGYQPTVQVTNYLHNEGRLSVGINKIQGEKIRHDVVKSYYDILSKKQRRFVTFRHYAVLAVASYRARNYYTALKYVTIAFYTSPKYFFIEAYEIFRK